MSSQLQGGAAAAGYCDDLAVTTAAQPRTYRSKALLHLTIIHVNAQNARAKTVESDGNQPNFLKDWEANRMRMQKGK